MKKTVYIIIAALTAFSCSDFLEKAPANKLSAETYFQSENDLKLYANGLINAALPDAVDLAMGEDLYTDFSGTKASKEFYQGSYSAAKASNWTSSTWSFPRRVAYMIDNMPRCKDKVNEEVYNHYEGVARFWRAWITMKRIKVFGDCYFIDKVIQPDDKETLYGPRQDREYIFHKIAEDLEFACANCLESGDGVASKGCVYINKYVALAFASRIFLYEGTYRKYHSVNPSTGKAWAGEYESSEDLLKLAEKYAAQLVEEGPYTLHKNFRELFVSEVLPSDEVIWGRTYSAELSKRHGVTYKYCSPTSSQLYSPTKEFVMMFLKTDGTPARGDVSVTEEFNGRDARLAATVLAPGMTRKNNDGTLEKFTPNWGWTVCGYQWIKWVQTEEDPLQSDTKSYNSMPIIRYGEVLLNYAEAAAELGHMDKALWDKTVGALRNRAGVANIYPGSAEYVPDQWLKDYYTKDVLHPAELSNTLLEIRRERATELTLEGQSRYDDLMRWCLGDLIERRYNHEGWRGIYITKEEFNDGFMWDGEHYTVSKSKSTNERNYKISGTGDNAWSLSENNHGYLIYHYHIVWDDKMYTHPIPLTAITVNENLSQNEGWQWM